MEKRITAVILCLIISGLFPFVNIVCSGERFVVSENSIKDEKTELIWHKKAFSMHTIMKTVFPDAKEGDQFTFDTGVIQKFLKTLKTDGKSDWRLPTEQELKRLGAPVLERFWLCSAS